MSDLENYSYENINVIDLRTKKLEEALLEIEKKPHLWLYENDLKCLYSFIQGWLVGRLSEEDEKLISDFDKYVVEKFGEGSSTAGWGFILRKNIEGSEELELFYEIFHEFLLKK